MRDRACGCTGSRSAVRAAAGYRRIAIVPARHAFVPTRKIPRIPPPLSPRSLNPLLAGACDVFGCALPPWRQPTAFAMLSREVIAVPDRPGVLRVQASFRNDARWAQAWPALVLTLADADGRVLGTRRFLPADYLGKAVDNATLAPGQATQIAFDIAEPAPAVVGFDFRFD